MLVDEDNADVFPLLRVSVEGLFYGSTLGFVVTNEEIALGVGRICNMANTCKKQTCNGTILRRVSVSQILGCDEKRSFPLTPRLQSLPETACPTSTCQMLLCPVQICAYPVG